VVGSRLRAAIACGAALAAAGPAWPEATRELAADPTLAALVEQSLAARPEVARAEAMARAQDQQVPQAGALPDPMLQLGLQNDGFRRLEIGNMETSYYSIMASQALPWPGKRRLRTQIAELGARQARSTATRARLGTEAEVRRAYLDLMVARDRLALLDDLQRLWQQSEGVARTRYQAGDGAQSDVLRSQLELGRLQQRRWTLQADERIGVQTLNRLRGHPLDEPVETSIHLPDLRPPPVPPAAAALEDALARSPELAAARIAAGQAQTSLSLARRSFYPDFVVSAAIMPRGGPFDPMWLLSIGSTLPIFAARKQSRAVAENDALALAAGKSVESVEQSLRLIVHQRRAVLSALSDTIRLYHGGLLVQSEATAASTLAQYKVGKVAFASVLEANAGYIADQDGYLLSIAEAQRILIAAAEVSLALGAASASGSMAPPSPRPAGSGM
jgi:outer membrane protein TolC